MEHMINILEKCIESVPARQSHENIKFCGSFETARLLSRIVTGPPFKSCIIPSKYLWVLQHAGTVSARLYRDTAVACLQTSQKRARGPSFSDHFTSYR